MSVYLVDNPPATRQYRTPRRAAPSGVVVVHTAESYPDETPPDTGAENVARFIARRTNPGSYHDLVDSDSLIQLVRYGDEAFHDATGSNPHSYGVSAATQAARWNQLGEAWVRSTVYNMALASARYARWLFEQRGILIPARRITRAMSEDREPGFISHAERDPARRTDPGADFPWHYYLATFAAIMAGQPDLPPTPPILGAGMLIVTPYGSTRHRAICVDAGKVVALTEVGHDRLALAEGVVSVALPNVDVASFEAAFGKPIEVDLVDVPPAE